MDQEQQPSRLQQPDNVVELTTTKIMGGGPAAAADLEKKRAIFFKACEIVVKQLDHDSQKIYEAAILGDMPMQARCQRMALVTAIRETMGWLQNLIDPNPPNTPPQQN